MIIKDRRVARDLRHRRVRRYVRGSAARPRLAVFRSLNHIYAQLIDDDAGRTLLAVDSRSKAFRAEHRAGGNIAAAKVGGALPAQHAKGHVGMGLGKAHEVPEAIRKAVEHAKKDLIFVPLKDTTIPCEITGHFGAGRVFLKPAVQGTGVIAGGAVRPILEAAGVQDILTKTLGSNNPHNVLKATLDALRQIKRLQDLHAVRRRGGDGTPAEEAAGGKQEA